MRASTAIGSFRFAYPTLFLLLVVALIAIALIVAACGGGDDDGASEQSQGGVTEPDTDDAETIDDAETEQSEDGTVSVQNPDADDPAEDEPAGEQPDDGDSQDTEDGAGDATIRNGIEIISLEGEGEGPAAQDGDAVGVRYRGTLDDGTEFDSNAGGKLLPVTIGTGGVIAGFDEALRGLRVGQTIIVRIPADLAYGVFDEALIFEFPREQTPPGMMEGQAVQLGNGIRATIVEITEEIVRIDANHELAGEALTFEISIEAFQ